MPIPKGAFKCVIMTPDVLLYQKNVHSIFLAGDKGEYELLAYHYPLLGVIRGNIILDWTECIHVKFGIVKFFANECMILAEEEETRRLKKKPVKAEREEDVVVDVNMENAVH